jgi:hypothetical protein
VSEKTESSAPLKIFIGLTNIPNIYYSDNTRTRSFLAEIDARTERINLEIKSIQKLEEFRSLGHFPLSFEEELKEVWEILSKLSKTEKDTLLDEARGMLNNYPNDIIAGGTQDLRSLTFAAIVEASNVIFG